MLLRFQKFFSKHKEIIFLIILLSLAAFLRIYRIADYMTFLGDEGRDVLVVWNILHGEFTLLGPTASVGGFFLGPIYYYFMAPFLFLFNYSAVGPAVMVALFGVATVFLVYKVGKEFFNSKVGFVSAFLYSIAPIIIAYSRSSWNPNLMPFFSLLTLYFCYKAVNAKKLYLYVFCGIFLGISLQLHYLATFLGAVVFFYILFFALLYPEKQNTISSKVSALVEKYLAVFVGFILGISPFLAFEVRHGFPNTQSIFRFIFSSGQVSGNNRFIEIIIDVFFRIFGRLVTNFPPPERISWQAHPIYTFWYWGVIALGICSLGIFLYQMFFVRKDRKKQSQYLLLLVWFVTGIFLFGLYKKSIYDYYFGFVFPLPFLFVGNLLYSIGKINFILKTLAICIFAILVMINISGSPFRYPANKQYKQAETIANFVLKESRGKPFNFALITGGNSDHAYRYFFEVAGRAPVVLENIQIDPERKSAADQLLIVCEAFPCQPLGNSLWEIAGFGQAEVAGEWNVSVVKVFRLVHYKGK